MGMVGSICVTMAQQREWPPKLQLGLKSAYNEFIYHSYSYKYC